MPANTEQQKPGQRGAPTDPLDVHVLLQQLTPRPLSRTVAVRGIVKSLHYFPDRKKPIRVYGDLLDQDQRSAVSFSCEPGSAPELTGEPVIIVGHLQITNSGSHSGFKVQIVGDRVGRWTPQEHTSSTPFILPPERARTPLNQLIERNSPKRMLLLGTELAIRDVLSQLGDAAPQPATKDLSTDLATLQNAIIAAAPAHAGLCLVRGGGDPGSFATFNHPELVKTLLTTGLPFYIAVGHAADLTLADKYADQSFPTPTAFGSAYLDACKARDKMVDMHKRLEQAHLQVEKLKAERGKLYKDARQQRLDENIHVLSKIATTLSQFPERVEHQANTAFTSAMRDFLPQLRHAIPRAHFAFWPSVLCSFLLGVVLCAFALSHAEATKLSALQAQLSAMQQEVNAATFLSKPTTRKAAH